MGPPALFPTLLFLNSNRHLNMSVGCEIATLPSTDKNIACKSIPWQVMRPRPEPMILLWVPFFIFNRTEPNRTKDQIGSISDLQKNELKSTVLWLWSVDDARVDEWRCINNQLYLSLSKETLNYSTKKLKVHEGEKIYGVGYYYWGKWWGVSEMWKMIVEMKTKQPCFVRENDSCWIVLIYHCTVHADHITAYTFLASSGRWPFPIYWMLHGSFRSAIVLTQPYLRRAKPHSIWKMQHNRHIHVSLQEHQEAIASVGTSWSWIY